MPVTPTYPGVYIEEIPSGVRTITGVATSITAFVGKALRGPVDEPVTIHGFDDFARVFGGLWDESGLGFSVQDFFLNGGGEAVVVRVFNPAEGAALEDAHAVVKQGELILKAAYPGEWGNWLRIRVTHVTEEKIEGELQERYGVAQKDAFFNLFVQDTATGATEEFVNLTTVDSPRKVDQVLAAQSRLVRVVGRPPAARPTKNKEEPDEGKTIWTDETTSQGVEGVDADPPEADAGSEGEAVTETELEGDPAKKTGIFALEKVDLFNLLVIPPLTPDGSIGDTLANRAMAYCERRRALFLVDPPDDWKDVDAARQGVAKYDKMKNGALYFPRIRKPNPLRENRLETFAPSGAVAGVMARTDVQRGVWKAPAGQEAVLVGVSELSVKLTDNENGRLNPLGINCLRSFPASGRVVWGARTLRGDDRLADEWKYVPVRRLALFIEESLYRGTQWVVFEPNDEPLWAQIRLNVGAFMHNLFRQGAFQGKSPRDAYFVRCDAQTTTQNDINLGIVNIVVGFAPLKPAEFVVIQLQQIAGKLDT